MLQNSPNKDEKGDKFFEYKNANYDIDTPDKNFNINNNKIKNEFEELIQNKNLDEKPKKNEEYIIFPKAKEDEENKIIRISNLKDNELPLEDKIQIENQVDNDNDNESEQIEIIENILNNFGNEKEKEKYKKHFLEYKNKKRFKKKSQSATNSKNSILNKIKQDIAKINFEQEINKISKNHNHNLILKGEKLNINLINNNQLKRINNVKIKSNILRIEEIRKKLSSGINTISKTNSIVTNHIRKENKNYINRSKNEKNFYNSCNNFYNNNQKHTIYDNLFNNTGNIREIKINNFNFNQIYNNFYDTFRNKRINNEYENKILPPNMTLNYKNKQLKSNDLTVNSLCNSNQFFYSVFINSIRKYPYLHLLKNKVNKMKNEEISKNVQDTQNLKAKENYKDKKESILDKINKQRDIFQKEIDKYKKK